MVRTERTYTFSDSRNQHMIIVDHPRDGDTVKIQTWDMREARISHHTVDRATAAALLWAKRGDLWRPAL